MSPANAPTPRHINIACAQEDDAIVPLIAREMRDREFIR